MKNRMKKLTMLLTNKKAYERTRSLYRKGVLAASVACFAVVPAFAADPLSAITQLSDFIWGVLQVGMSIQSHDPSQRTQGILCLVGGLLIMFAKDILDLITGG